MHIKSNIKYHFNTFAWADEQELPGFGKLLNSWLQVHKNYCNELRPEHSWEYEFKELSHVGFLSNAGVMINGIALVEHEIKKKSGDGRNDLFLRLHSQTRTHDYFIEAKWAAIDLKWQENDVLNQITRLMGIAIDSAKQIDPAHLKPNNGKAVAVSFFILIFEDGGKLDLDERTSALLNFIQEKQCGQLGLGLNALGSICFSAEEFQQNQRDREENGMPMTNIVGLHFMAKVVDGN